MNEYRIQRLKEDLTYAQQRNKKQRQQLANYKKVHEKDLKEIERLKEEYMMLQNASDEVEEEKDKEIERLTFESTKWESKFYDEAKKVDRAIEYIEQLTNDEESIELMDIDSLVQEELLKILKGSDKE